jgi:hypothetical protein
MVFYLALSFEGGGIKGVRLINTPFPLARGRGKEDRVGEAAPLFEGA